MNIIVIAPSIKMGGAENAGVNFANALQNNGCKVSFISIFRQPHFFKLNDEIKLYEPDEFNIKKLYLFKTILWLRKIIKKENPDVIIVLQKFYSAMTILSLLRKNYKIIISERSSPLFKWSLPVSIFNRIIFTLRKPDGIIAQTSIAAEYQRKYYGNNVPIKVIPNIVKEIKLFPEIKRENFILAVGRLNDHLKGFDRLIEVVALMKNDWSLYIAGGDEEGIALKKLAKKLGVESRVKFLGKVKEMDKLYALAGLFVIPSRSEGFPNALVEAMAAGLPCIAFDFIAGPRDIIKDRVDGIIVEDGNLQKMANAIDELVYDEKKRIYLGMNALKVREKFSESNIIKSLTDFINDVRK